MQDTLRELLLCACAALVDTPDAVQIETETTEDGALLYTITVADNEAGQVIGKNGHIANALRALLMSAAKQRSRGARALLQIVAVNDAVAG